MLLKCYCFPSEWYEMLHLQNAYLLGWNTDGLYHGGEDPGSMSNMLWLSLPQQPPQPLELLVLHSCPDPNHRSRIVSFIHTHSKWVHSFQKLQICQQNETRYNWKVTSFNAKHPCFIVVSSLQHFHTVTFINTSVLRYKYIQSHSAKLANRRQHLSTNDIQMLRATDCTLNILWWIYMNKCYYGLRNILGPELLQKDKKCKIYKTLIRPVVLYGCESGTLIKTDEAKLSIFERKILGKIYSPSGVNGVWGIKYNDELYSL